MKKSNSIPKASDCARIVKNTRDSRMNGHVDIIIIGGGLVGMTLARALSGHGWEIALLDAKALPDKRAHHDGRSLALSYASQKILQTLGLWSEIAAHATAIDSVHIAKPGLFAKTYLEKSELELPALGYVVPAELLAAEIAEAISKLPDVKIFSQTRVQDLQIKDKIAEITIEQTGKKQTLSARLVIAADGSQSSVAEKLGIYQQTHAYHQTAIVSTFSCDQPHHHIAYEFFTQQGVIAFLPRKQNQYGVVWTTDNTQAQRLLALSENDYLNAVIKQTHHFWGNELQMSEVISYPLTAVSAYEMIRPRFVLLGNAVHTMHPVAAQGLNLALRSVAWLAEILVENKKDMAELNTLKRYQHEVQAFQQKTQFGMHTLAELTGKISAKPLWSAGLTLLDRFPSGKRAFMRRMTGLAGKQAKLIRGVSLYE